MACVIWFIAGGFFGYAVAALMYAAASDKDKEDEE